MKRKKTQVSSFRMLCISLAVSIVVVGIGGAVFAQASDGGLILKLKAVGEFLQILDKSDVSVGEANVGLLATTDETQTANFNNLGLRTNSDHPDTYVNVHEEYMELLSNAASSTVLSIKNTWEQWILVTDTFVFPTSAVSSGLYISAGTSTNQSAASYNATTDISKCAINNQFITTSTMDFVSSISPANAAPERGGCLVAPGDFFLVHVMTENPVISVTSSPLTSLGADLKATARVRVISTSTSYY